jgi:hypothetical protein
MISQWTNDDFGSKRLNKKTTCFVLRPYRLVTIHRPTILSLALGLLLKRFLGTGSFIYRGGQTLMASPEMDFGLQRQSIHFRRHFKKDRLLKLFSKGPLLKLSIFRGRPIKRPV